MVVVAILNTHRTTLSEDAQTRMQDAGCRTQDAGRRMRDARLSGTLDAGRQAPSLLPPASCVLHKAEFRILSKKVKSSQFARLDKILFTALRSHGGPAQLPGISEITIMEELFYSYFQ